MISKFVKDLCKDFQDISAAYKEYKLNNGPMKWNEFQKQYGRNING